MTKAQVDLHLLDDRERLQLENWSKSLLIEHITVHNQSIQLDPVITHLRILARLKKKGDPEFAALVNTIGEIKGLAKTLQLSSRLLYMLIKPYIKLDNAPAQMKLVEEFIQNLIVNNLFNKLVGPPCTLMCHEKLHEEQHMWPDHLTLVKNINETMKEDSDHPMEVEYPQKAKVRWVAENFWSTISVTVKLDLISTNVWGEFLGFNHLMSQQIHQDMQSPYFITYNWKKIQEWAEKEMKGRLKTAKDMVNYHDFFYPTKLDWLNFHTPIFNQSVMLATAYPPIIVDMSTEEDEPFRRPPQWSTFPQYHERLVVEMKNLRHSHAFEVMF